MSPTVSPPATIVFSPDGSLLPASLEVWLYGQPSPVIRVGDDDELMAIALRSRPRLVVFDARATADSLSACTRLKKDSYTGVVPAFVLCADGIEAVRAAFDAGADEAIVPGLDEREVIRRLEAVLSRSHRDLGVHPSTRLPGAGAIEAEISRRLKMPDLFAVCYADLDHFKEYNDRYSYNEGDRVIRILAMLLHDVAKGLCGERAFVGHIGGDDFIFIIPYDSIAETCGEITSIFDLLVPYQYSEIDRRAGYFFGKDRRGVLDRVPLMTLSIGVVTNAQRTFTEPRQVSRLATEMKTYAKTLEGSVYSIDRRTDDRPPVFEVPYPGLNEAGEME
ncbi:MAG TPA: diguanylate cyclase [Gemmatimonadaceae bacterium]|nr:diguanylate cyclase [Gemmatimonadaceae bacterium]